MAGKSVSDPMTFDFLFHVLLAWLMLKLQIAFLYLSGAAYRNSLAGRPAQMFRVRTARRLIFMTSRVDFFPFHDSFVSIDYLLRDTVSLYTMDATSFYFVEVPESVDVYSSDTDPFMFNAQYDHATRLIRVPLKHFLQFADSLETPSAPVILLSNTGRCGSTILAQMFERTSQIASLSEPDAMAKVFDYPKLVTGEVIAAMFKVMVKPQSRKPVAYVIKPKSQCLCLVPLLHRAMPEVKHIYMYRNGMATIHSMFKAFVGNPEMGELKKFEDFLKLMSYPLFQVAVYGARREDLTCCHTSLMTWWWASSLRFYLDYRAQGIPLAALKYEDLLADPEGIFAQVLRLCDLPTDLSKMAAGALEKDSQRGLSISRDRSKKKDASSLLPTYDEEEVKTRCDALCDLLQVPRLDQNAGLPGTIGGTETS